MVVVVLIFVFLDDEILICDCLGEMKVLDLNFCCVN